MPKESTEASDNLNSESGFESGLFEEKKLEDYSFGADANANADNDIIDDKKSIESAEAFHAGKNAHDDNWIKGERNKNNT